MELATYFLPRIIFLLAEQTWALIQLWAQALNPTTQMQAAVLLLLPRKGTFLQLPQRSLCLGGVGWGQGQRASPGIFKSLRINLELALSPVIMSIIRGS